jgi:hypothetical protein
MVPPGTFEKKKGFEKEKLPFLRMLSLAETA